MTEAPTLQSIEQFLFHEARCLDEQRWTDWESLFVEDGEYWVPATQGQPDPLQHMSIMYEKSLLRAVRLKRYSHPNAMSLQPQPRTAHIISNVMLDKFDKKENIALSNARFLMLEFRRDTQNVYGGSVSHRLRCTDEGGFLIEQKKVELINCEGVLSSIQVYF